MIELIPLSESVNATVGIPGSKSITNRALILAVLTPGVVTIQNPLICDDTNAMVACLTKLGIAIEQTADAFVVSGSYLDVKNDQYHLDARLSGTTIRFLTALCCNIPGIKTISGQPPLNKRPIKGLVDALRLLGAQIEYLGKDGYPPIIISSSHLHPRAIEMDGSISSQFITAIMLLEPIIGMVPITFSHPPISKPYIDLTKHMLKKGKKEDIHTYHIEGDYSAAGYFAAIATLTHSTITLTNLTSDSKQGDMRFLDILAQMGTEINYKDGEVVVRGCGVKPIKVDMEQCPDQVQTLAVLAAFAKGRTLISGVRSLRVKETERVKAVQQELAKMGIRTESPDKDTLIIYGGSPKPATIKTYGDHRMAMSFAIAGSKLHGMKINDPHVVHKTFPGFWNSLQEIGILVEHTS